MSDKEAAVLIGRFFPEIKDKLLNTLQLADKIDDYSESEEGEETYGEDDEYWDTEDDEYVDDKGEEYYDNEKESNN